MVKCLMLALGASLSREDAEEQVLLAVPIVSSGLLFETILCRQIRLLRMRSIFPRAFFVFMMPDAHALTDLSSFTLTIDQVSRLTSSALEPADHH